jgi:3-hydroxyisobutyrate dehydrogenase-like beta-hydroxyacid dehydrogenase
MEKVAFLGLGTMGSAMADKIARAGFDLVVWNRTRERCRPLEDLGAGVAASPREAVAGADAVLYDFGPVAAIDEVVLADGGVVSALRGGEVAVDLSTTHPAVSRRQEEAFRARGVDFLDAPVFGSRPEADAGVLRIIVGGDASALERVRPVLETFSASIHHMGGAGAGAAMSLVGSLIVCLQLEALSEALVLASRAGLDARQALEVIQLSDFQSPLFGGMGAGILERDFGAVFALKHLQKDADLIAELAEELGVPVPGAALVREMIKVAVNRGAGDENASALIKALELQANLVVSG